jgi:predicted CDP-diglyceride synthetase/phosphatidate cytidylyltransferase
MERKEIVLCVIFSSLSFFGANFTTNSIVLNKYIKLKLKYWFIELPFFQLYIQSKPGH